MGYGAKILEVIGFDMISRRYLSSSVLIPVYRL